MKSSQLDDMSSSGLWHVYIMHCADGTLYTGITTNVARRLSQHNDGKASKYTRSRLPVKPVMVEVAFDRSRALRRELEIKRMPRAAKWKLIHSRILAWNRQ